MIEKKHEYIHTIKYEIDGYSCEAFSVYHKCFIKGKHYIQFRRYNKYICVNYIEYNSIYVINLRSMLSHYNYYFVYYIILPEGYPRPHYHKLVNINEQTAV